MPRGITYNKITPECREFLLAGTHTAKLATVREDGRPHVVPVWFDIDGEDIVFTTWLRSVKGKNMQRDPRVCICVDNESPPFSFMQVEGTASISDEPEALKAWAARLGGRYMGQETADYYGERNGVPGEVVVRVRPTRIVVEWNVTD